jgi:dUTP pyrophosphatase
MLYCVSLAEGAKLPTVSHPGEDLGYDIYALDAAVLYPGVVTKVRTGISARFVDDSNNVFVTVYGLLFRDRSSMASLGITVSGGVIDAGYTGELIVLLTNHNTRSYTVEAGAKIVQMIPTVVQTVHGVADWVSELPASSRAAKGFGSSGK